MKRHTLTSVELKQQAADLLEKAAKRERTENEAHMRELAYRCSKWVTKNTDAAQVFLRWLDGDATEELARRKLARVLHLIKLPD
mgnify:CR=1 FL=1